MPAIPHQRVRAIFQRLWFALFACLLLTGTSRQVWLGLAGAGLISALLVKRAACSFACPLFPVGELLWRGGRRLFGRNFVVPFWFDLPLRTAKYLVLGGVILALSGKRPGAAFDTPAIVFFALAAAALLALSLFYQMPWCRYLCPAGALIGLVSPVSLLKIRRSPQHCVRCHKCSHCCPASLAVMQRITVRSPECFACYRCVDGCPAPGALAFASPGKHAITAWQAGVTVSCILLTGLLAGFFR